MKPIKLEGFDEHGVQEPTRSWIVCWTIAESLQDDDFVDHWQVCDSYKEAKELHDSLYEDGSVLIRAMCAVIDSSDYEPHPAFREPKQLTEAEYQAAINT